MKVLQEPTLKNGFYLILRPLGLPRGSGSNRVLIKAFPLHFIYPRLTLGILSVSYYKGKVIDNITRMLFFFFKRYVKVPINNAKRCCPTSLYDVSWFSFKNKVHRISQCYDQNQQVCQRTAITAERHNRLSGGY